MIGVPVGAAAEADDAGDAEAAAGEAEDALVEPDVAAGEAELAADDELDAGALDVGVEVDGAEHAARTRLSKLSQMATVAPRCRAGIVMPILPEVLVVFGPGHGAPERVARVR